MFFKKKVQLLSLNLTCFRLVQLLEVLDLTVKRFEYQTSKKKKSPKSKSNNSIPAKSHSLKSISSATDPNKERLKSLENAIMNPSASQEMRRRKEASIGMLKNVLPLLEN